MLKCKSISCFCPVHFSWSTFPDRGANPKTPLRRSQEPSHSTPKPQGFASESVFSREFTCFRTVTLPNYLMMSGWLMMWWTWWYECYPWPSSVVRKFSITKLPLINLSHALKPNHFSSASPEVKNCVSCGACDIRGPAATEPQKSWGFNRSPAKKSRLPGGIFHGI